MATRPSKPTLKRKVYSKAKRANDLETHVSLVTIGGESLIDIRDYVPSTKQYGRGATFSSAHLETVWTGLQTLEADLVTDA